MGTSIEGESAAAGLKQREVLILFWRWFANLTTEDAGTGMRENRWKKSRRLRVRAHLTVGYIGCSYIGSRVSALEGCQQVGIVAD